MKIFILAVGKLSMPYRKLEEDFLKRMKNVHILEIKESSKLKETREILKKLERKDWFVVLCDVRGESFTSEQFSKFLREKLLRKDVCFLIGGPDGLDTELLENHIDFKLSLSKMTFNHQLCRIILLEQLYRAMMFWKDHPYAKH